MTWVIIPFPLRMPHLFTSNDPHFGHLWRLLIFDLSLIRWKHFHLIYVIFWIIPIYETFTNHFWQLYHYTLKAAPHPVPRQKKRRWKTSLFLSGYCDSNTGPSGPKPDALANCATPRFPEWDCKYTPFFRFSKKNFKNLHFLSYIWHPKPSFNRIDSNKYDYSRKPEQVFRQSPGT